ncbi:hypothetical protein QBC39DRAFT_335109 [Podospora conica]|nr:hypothetical protein QBC39DRAFT_335109 [Schizothecium conicum]
MPSLAIAPATGLNPDVHATRTWHDSMRQAPLLSIMHGTLSHRHHQPLSPSPTITITTIAVAAVSVTTAAETLSQRDLGSNGDILTENLEMLYWLAQVLHGEDQDATPRQHRDGGVAQAITSPLSTPSSTTFFITERIHAVSWPPFPSGPSPKTFRTQPPGEPSRLSTSSPNLSRSTSAPSDQVTPSPSSPSPSPPSRNSSPALRPPSSRTRSSPRKPREQHPPSQFVRSSPPSPDHHHHQVPLTLKQFGSPLQHLSHPIEIKQTVAQGPKRVTICGKAAARRNTARNGGSTTGLSGPSTQHLPDDARQLSRAIPRTTTPAHVSLNRRQWVSSSIIIHVVGSIAWNPSFFLGPKLAPV